MSFTSLHAVFDRRTSHGQVPCDRPAVSGREQSARYIEPAGWCRAALTAAIAIAAIALPASGHAEGSFRGFYVGVNAGAAWGRTSFATNPNCPPSIIDATFCNSSPDPSAPNGVAVATSGTGRLSPSGFAGGVQAGYNLQTGILVFGAEADFGAFRLAEFRRCDRALSVHVPRQPVHAHGDDEGQLARNRARAPGHQRHAACPVVRDRRSGFLGVQVLQQLWRQRHWFRVPRRLRIGGKSDTRTGWTAGGGVEWLLDRNWSIKAEYLYVDLGSMNVLVPVSNTAAFSQTMQVNADLTAQVARLGLNFRFSTRPPRRPTSQPSRRQRGCSRLAVSHLLDASASGRHDVRRDLANDLPLG